jgi:protein-tyrosine phosphatase
VKILFVCLGNICRSPTAEAVLRSLAAREAPELAITVDSAGTANYHPGAPPDRRSQAAARQRAYDLSQLRARQICNGDFA